MSRAARRTASELANAIISHETMNVTEEISIAIFRPIRSKVIPAQMAPHRPPNRQMTTTHDDCSFVMGIGESSLRRSGRYGDDHPYWQPLEKVATEQAKTAVYWSALFSKGKFNSFIVTSDVENSQSQFPWNNREFGAPR
uniref:Uncharacterized protein n=1 Tax=Photinus pyralis TaxID=7054 RepID=A0A1Y1NGT7_PHOPY